MVSDNQKSILRFTTAGSVDDGKSTLIGRLLYDSKSIFEDQYESVKATSEKRGEEYLNLAYFTDGLRAEREQGITIDVAYRYFSTPHRKFIIADTPGHIQYTRNMVTGASTADAALILIDARKGILQQTVRHSYIASLLGISHIVVCVNKMDLVNYQENIFEEIKTKYKSISSKLNINNVQFVPISALKGDNVVELSCNMNWYQGESVLSTLEKINVDAVHNLNPSRFPIQYVIRPTSNEYHDYRGYAGRVASGIFKKGDEVIIFPSQHKSKIKSIDTLNGSLNEASSGMSVAITLENEIDISRGDMIAKVGDEPQMKQEVDVMICWLSEKKLELNGKYVLRHTTKELRCIVKIIHFKMNIDTLEKIENEKSIELNDIGKITIKTTTPILVDSYKENRITGSIILIDEATNVTVGAGMIM